MRSGELRSRVVIETPEGDDDGRGGTEDIDWRLVFQGPCSVDDQWARERLAAGALEGNVGTAIRIRYRTDIAVGMRARVISGVGIGIYNITGIQEVKARGTGRPEQIALACEKGGAV